MSNNEETKRVLKMIEEGKITSAEGLELINALESTDIVSKEEVKWLRVRVRSGNDKTKVNVNIPISLVDVALKIGSGFSPELKNFGEDKLKEIMEAIKSGAEGKIVDVYDENEDTTVEVYVE